MWTCSKCGRIFKRTNQDHYCGKAPASIDEYIERQDAGLQPTLMDIRSAIHDAIPDAEEKIAWSMPTWKKKGYIIHFAVSRNHIGVHMGESAVAFFQDRLQGIETHNGVVHLKFDGAIPLSLIADMAKWCYAMDQGGTA